MFCTKCGTSLAPDSAFCNQCGASQVSPTAPTVSSTSPTVPNLAPKPDAKSTMGPEQEIWKGRFSGKSYAHYWTIWILYAAALAYVPFAVPQIPREKWMWWTLTGFVGAPALCILWMTFIQKVSIRYRLTTQRFFKESGIISRKVSEIELIRIDDVAVQQNILQRIFNVGLVTVISTDATDPRLAIAGIDDPIGVKEKIRTQVRQRRSGAMYMESL